jgi:simple sugar transport system ATP-binding protein
VSAPALALEGVTRRFGAVTALDEATLTVRPGTVHALLGENGAGKSTLMRIAFGMLAPDAGTVRVQGTAHRFSSARDAIDAGLGMVHQHFSLVPALTVAENVALGGRGRFDRAAVASQVRALGVETGLALDPEALVSTLPVSAQQRLEILKALARQARVLILDEPTAVLAPAEARDLLAWVKQWATGDRAVVLITHHLADALAVADDVTVLRRGRTVLERPVRELDEAALVLAMLGEPLREQAAERAGRTPGGEVVLALEAATIVDGRGVRRLAPTSCAVRAGEIVGVAAVEGSGQAELLRLLAGRLAPTTGRATVPASVGFVPADRHRDAVVLDMPLVENLALKDAARAPAWMPWPALRAETAEVMTRFDVRAAGAMAPMRSLSGGNQQKFVMARELAGAPLALVVENPTRGLDIRATEDVRARLRAARTAGLAVVMYSEDLDEVLALADRVLVVHAGVVQELAPDRELVGRAMLGAQ